ncbi:MAG: hypothetical protein M1294_10295 [Firmicutes bacterium]|nr:hypothetical protein [Bacillota bacterium]
MLVSNASMMLTGLTFQEIRLLSNNGSASVTTQITWHIQSLSRNFTSAAAHPSAIA